MFLCLRRTVTRSGQNLDVNSSVVQSAAPISHAEIVLGALEAMPADLRLMVGWPRLFALVLDAVLAVEGRSAGNQRQTTLLTLMIYCYASNLLTSEDIEAACVEEADVAYIADGVIFSAVELRAFRRNNRSLVEKSLQHVFCAALMAVHGQETIQHADLSALLSGVQEFARRRLSLALVFDTAMSE